MTRLFLSAVAALFFLSAAVRADAPKANDKLVVHEWGTFTALQDEQGRTIRGINTDDELLPDFVHNAHGGLLQNPSEIPPVQFKGVSRVHPDVIVRLETPVLYFYPPRDKPQMKLDVQVDFRGGWLTQFYPNADAKNPGLQNDRTDTGSIRSGTVGSLRWYNVKVGGKVAGPRTDSRVWLAPREVDAASVNVGEETERYIFYRGVAKIDPPLQVSRDPHNADRLQLQAKDQTDIRAAWLIDVRQDGAIAMRGLGRVAGGEDFTRVDSKFADGDYATDHLKIIRGQLKKALMGEGLYEDEAEAMMNTWEAAYFKRPGLRVFFMVPRGWTDAILPLHISGAGETGMDIQRAMIGRIELVTPFQRERLQRIGKTVPASPMWLNQSLETAHAGKTDKYREEWFRDIFSGQRSLLNENIQMPPEYRDYLQLGRFRNALILDELTQRPTANLKKFVEAYDLQYSKVDPESEASAAANTATVVPAAK